MPQTLVNLLEFVLFFLSFFWLLLLLLFACTCRLCCSLCRLAYGAKIILCYKQYQSITWYEYIIVFYFISFFFVVKTNNDLHIWCCMVQWIIQIHNSNEVNAPPGSSFSFLCCFSCLPTVFRCCNVPSKVKCWWFPSFQLGLCVTQGVALHSYVHSLFIEHLLPLIFV